MADDAGLGPNLGLIGEAAARRAYRLAVAIEMVLQDKQGNECLMALALVMARGVRHVRAPGFTEAQCLAEVTDLMKDMLVDCPYVVGDAVRWQN